jgi:hypothetical protein
MRDIPNCARCKIKCYGCKSYATCLMRQEINGYKIEDCTFVASKYYNFEEYFNNPHMSLCRFQDECKSLIEAWQ